MLTFIIGFLIHKFVKIDSSFYKGNIVEDLKHFLFYWYEGSNKFRLSKTKIITVIILIIGFINGLQTSIAGESGGYVIGTILVSVVFAIPVSLIGFVLHKSKSKNNTSTGYVDNNVNDADHKASKTVLNEDISDISLNYVNYVLKANELKKEFDEKEFKTRELIKTKFSPPQITYDRFIAVVDNCSKIFNEQYLSILNLVNYSKSDSEKIKNEINSKIDNMESIINKLDDLSNELVINVSKSNDEDINNVLNNMESLIASIHNYED